VAWLSPSSEASAAPNNSVALEETIVLRTVTGLFQRITEAPQQGAFLNLEAVGASYHQRFHALLV